MKNLFSNLSRKGAKAQRGVNNKPKSHLSLASSRLCVRNYTVLLWSLAGIAFLLLLWELAARHYGSELILPGPLPVLNRFAELVLTQRFLLALGNSLLRVFWGICIAVPLGVAAGIAAGLDKRAHAFLKPLFSVISATPVLSLILIAFLVLGSSRTPVFTAFLMIFPVMAANVIEGIGSTDVRLKELFAVFKMNRRETLKYLYIPSLVPFILGGLRSSLSLCWKVVVAAEVLVQPMRSLGAGMQQAKAHLETPELFAWTAATIIAASSSQGILSLIITRRKSVRGLTRINANNDNLNPHNPRNLRINSSFDVRNLSFSYTDQPLISNLNLTIENTERPLVILGPSGSGKTTLLRLFAGLLEPQEGEILLNNHAETQSREEKSAANKSPATLRAFAPLREQNDNKSKTSFMFQEPRLLPWLTVLENVSLPLEKDFGKIQARDRARFFLSLVSLNDKENVFPHELSGGQAQRVSMARAFAWPAPALFMDEPFQSLDIPLRINLMDLCLSLLEKEKRLLVAVTHDPREAIYLGSRIIVLGQPGQGIVFDKSIALTAAERAYGSSVAAELERELIAALQVFTANFPEKC